MLCHCFSLHESTAMEAPQVFHPTDKQAQPTEVNTSQGCAADKQDSNPGQVSATTLQRAAAMHLYLSSDSQAAQ